MQVITFILSNIRHTKLYIKIYTKLYVTIHIAISGNTHCKLYILKLDYIDCYGKCYAIFGTNFSIQFNMLNIILLYYMHIFIEMK